MGKCQFLIIASDVTELKNVLTGVPGGIVWSPRRRAFIRQTILFFNLPLDKSQGQVEFQFLLIGQAVDPASFFVLFCSWHLFSFQGFEILYREDIYTKEMLKSESSETIEVEWGENST